uniref:Phytanoyl-CoA hydroxylase-interacting protein-like C-terminal domain-containing protein n=1 Tax=Ditylenchus dipsaci TaxID=166011 RepID=A0A915EEJ8_9BILA
MCHHQFEKWLSDHLSLGRLEVHQIPGFRLEKKPYAQSAGFQHLLTPHASEEAIALRRESLEEEHRMKKPRLYNDFSEPSRPKTIQLRVESSAIKCAVFWNFPDLSTKTKYKQQIEITEVTDDLAPKGKMVAEGTVRCKAAFSLDEIDKLMARAISATGKAMHSFSYLYRCKPKYYWDEIYMHRMALWKNISKTKTGKLPHLSMEKLKVSFFRQETLPDGHLPPSSPFGDMRMHLPAFSLLNPAEINILTMLLFVVCKKGSSTDNFCRDRIRPLNVRNNPFLRVEPLDSLDRFTTLSMCPCDGGNLTQLWLQVLEHRGLEGCPTTNPV